MIAGYNTAIGLESDVALAFVLVNLLLNFVGMVRPVDSTPSTWWTGAVGGGLYFVVAVQQLVQTHWWDAAWSFVLAAMWFPKRPPPRRPKKAKQGTWQMPAWIEAMMKPRPRLSYGP